MRRSKEGGGNEERGSLLLFWGRALCVLGILCALVGSFFVSVALGAIGIFLGIAGDVMGARNLGRLVVILGVISIFVGLFIGQGVMAGSYDEMVNGFKESRLQGGE